MRGGSGADRLSGGAGVDRLFGGSGADRLLARDRSADRADCGRGRDRATVDAKDTRARLRTVAAWCLYFSALIKRSHTAAPRTA